MNRRGGKRNGAGRKPSEETPLKFRGLMATDDQWKKAKALSKQAGMKGAGEWIRERIKRAKLTLPQGVTIDEYIADVTSEEE